MVSGSVQPDAISNSLTRARRVWNAVQISSRLLRGCTFLLLALLAALVADNVLNLPRGIRMVCALGLIGGAAYVFVVQLALCLRQRLTNEMVAAHVERAYPELDNHLINSVLLQKEDIGDPLARQMADSQLRETIGAVRLYDMAASTNRKPIWRWAKWTALLALLTAGYGVAFGQYFSNAVKRLALPTKHIPPITHTQLSVTPGDAECVQGESLTVRAQVRGVVPETAHIYMDAQDGEELRKEMPFEGSTFVHKFTGVQQDFRYWVRAGDAVSPVYQVTVLTRPSVESMNISYYYPEYTGLSPKTELTQLGNIKALVGTRIRLQVKASRQLSEASLVLRCFAPGQEHEEDEPEVVRMAVTAKEAQGEFEVGHSGEYTIALKGEDLIPNEPLVRQIVALPDDPPLVTLLEPGRDLAVAPDEKIILLGEAKDDFSLLRLALLVQRNDDAEWKEQRVWDYRGGVRNARESVELDMEALELQPGNTLTYYLRGSDGRPGRDENAGRSRVYQITVLDQVATREKQKEQEEALRDVIRRLITIQKQNLVATRQLGGWQEAGGAEITDDEEAGNRFAARANGILKAEQDVYVAATEAVRENAGAELEDLVEGLADIASDEIALAVEQLGALRNVPAAAQIAPAAATAAQTEEQIVKLLEALLQDAHRFVAERLEKKGRHEKLPVDEEPLLDTKQTVERMLEKLKEFKDEQREVIEMTKKLAPVPVDDFTDEQEAELEAIAQIERKWAQYFQERATDLSKVPPQDQSVGAMAKECLEVYSELQKAAAAAQSKVAEIATSMEEGAIAKAETIEENIEKWLMEQRDSITWKMEDPETDFDLPLVPLPDELEDLIGELLDAEDEMMEEADDATSAWLGSMDKGIGWDAMDGPMPSMSAKGVTGNQLPNANEIGGRSGEGRTGKSSGSMVEDTATGKGGRKTPTRLTPNPFEPGAVKDTSAEPATGASGGGKLSGTGQEGLQGPPPPAAQQALKRMANMQQQILDKARRLDKGLQEYEHPRGRLPSTIELMEQLKINIEEGDLSTAGRQHKLVLQGLREVKSLVSAQKDLLRDRTALLPKEIREDISSSRHEQAPRQYRQMVDNYYRALSEAHGTR